MYIVSDSIICVVISGCNLVVVVDLILVLPLLMRTKVLTTYQLAVTLDLNFPRSAGLAPVVDTRGTRFREFYFLSVPTGEWVVYLFARASSCRVRKFLPA